MPQRLHRLEVRNMMLPILAEYSIPARNVVSREAGYIDVFVPAAGGPHHSNIRTALVNHLGQSGVEILMIGQDYIRRQRVHRLRFQNDLMLQQAQWGARQMSRSYRVRNGIDADARPNETRLVMQRQNQPEVTIHPPYADDRVLAERQERARNARLYDELVPLVATAMAVEPLTEETQDEPDSGILTRVRITSVALEQSEIG